MDIFLPCYNLVSAQAHLAATIFNFLWSIFLHCALSITFFHLVSAPAHLSATIFFEVFLSIVHYIFSTLLLVRISVCYNLQYSALHFFAFCIAFFTVLQSCFKAAMHRACTVHRTSLCHNAVLSHHFHLSLLCIALRCIALLLICNVLHLVSAWPPQSWFKILQLVTVLNGSGTALHRLWTLLKFSWDQEHCSAWPLFSNI